MKQDINYILKKSTELCKESESHWRNVLHAVGRFSVLGFKNALLISSQRPDASALAPYSMWSRAGYYVIRGSKGVLVDKVVKVGLTDQYLFDISDTGKKKNAKEFPDTSITEDELYDLCHWLHFQKYSHIIANPDEIEKNFQVSIESFARRNQVDEKQAIQALMFNLTYGKIFSIVESEKDVIEQIEHLKNAALEEFPELLSIMEHLVIGSSLCAILDRYNMAPVEEFIGDSAILKGTFGFAQFADKSENYESIRRFFSNHQLFHELGEIICSVTEKTKTIFQNQLEEIKKERGVSYERNDRASDAGRLRDSSRGERENIPDHNVGGISAFPGRDRGVSSRERTELQGPGEIRTGGRGRDAVPGNERTSVSGDRDDGRYSEKQSGLREAGQIRTDGGGIHEGELSVPIRGTVVRTRDRERAAGSGKGSEGADRPNGRELLEETQGGSERGLHEDRAVKEHGTHDGGESSDRTDYKSVSLNKQEPEIRQLELSDFSVPGNDPDASGHFDQKSEDDPEMISQISRAEYEAQGKKARSDVYIPEEYIVQMLLRGTGFQGGKQRILEIYEKLSDPSDRVTSIKKEYGQGGAGWPIEGYGLHGYDTFQSKGIHLQWRDGSGEKEGYLSWKQVEQHLQKLIAAGKYQEDEVMKKKKPETSGQNVQKSNEIFGIPVTYHHAEQELPVVGKKQLFRQNIDAIKALKTIEKENRYAHPEEQHILARYRGWGGLSAAFDEKNPVWKSEYLELKELLGEEEYRFARSSVGDSFYTPQFICDMMAERIKEMGFEHGNVLEPSCGIGNFLDSMCHLHKEHTEPVNYYAVELDDVTSRIAKALYPAPECHIEHCGYEETSYPDNFFDVIVGNVPFGSYHVNDPKYNRENFFIHDYFLAKSMDQVRPGGIVAVITSKGTLDKKNSSTRKYLAERAELIGAIRLPGKTFEAYAGTEVTSDILFFQKREKKISIEPDWVYLGVTEDGIPVNAYFEQHPEMMLGKMKYDSRIFGKDSNYTVCTNDDPDFDLRTELQKCLSKIVADRELYNSISEPKTEAENEIESIPADPDVRNFTYTVVDGELFYRENSRMSKVELSDAQKQRMTGIIQIRDLTRKLITVQKDGCTTEELKQMQENLNVQYDAFIKKYGYLTNRMNESAFSEDADYILLSALEEIDEDGLVRKAKMFTHQTIRPQQEILSVESAVEALQLSVSELGEVNLPFMLSVYEPDLSDYRQYLDENRQETLGWQITKQMGKDAQTEAELKLAVLLDELEGFIFLNPVRYDENHLETGWETKDEYLSGDVREKLFFAKSRAKSNEIFKINVEALEKVQPEWLSAADIDVRIGTTWIEIADYEAFLYETLRTPARLRSIRSSYYNAGIMIHQNPLTGEYSIENKGLDRHSIIATQDYGTFRADAYNIFEDTLNLRTVTVRDRIDDGDGKYHYEVNQKETLLAREKQTLIKEKFKEWIFSDIERREKYEKLYNERFNNIRLREYDGSYLQFPGMNPELELLPHQKDAVARVILGGNTLLAHCVGAGKSFEMIASIMEQKRLGLIHKAAMVVPKALIGQTASEFLRLYPGANVLVTTEKDFSLKNRRRFVARIATGDYDCVIMSHSQFESMTCC